VIEKPIRPSMPGEESQSVNLEISE